MTQPSVDALLRNSVSWLSDNAPDDDIAISSRVRLARNLANLPFPINADEDRLRQSMTAIGVAVDRLSLIPAALHYNMENLTALDRQFLMERRLISREFGEEGVGRSLIVDAKETIGLMINEEDHARLQIMGAGLALSDLWMRLNALDDRLGEELPYAFDETLGYLTSCPTNVGTGMRASVMLHLPALALGGHISGVVQGVNKLGLAVRGIYGEGSESVGGLFQVSNQSSLGENEDQIISRLENIIRQIINHEKNAREKLLESRKNYLLDTIGRAYGTLRYAYKLSSDEALNSLSTLRMGVDMDMFAALDIKVVNALFILIQPAHLQKFAGKTLNSEERDILRAEIVREKLKG